MLKSFIPFLMLILLGGTLWATDFQIGESVTIDQPMENNIFLMTSEIVILAPVRGDLFAMTGQCSARDTLHDDVLLLAGDIDLEAPCMDDVRVLTGDIKVNEVIRGDLMVLSGNLILGPDGVIEGSLHLLTGSAILNGRVVGDVHIKGSEVTLNGPIGGALNITSGELNINNRIEGPSKLAAGSLTLGEGAFFNQNVRYYAGNQDDLDFSGKLEAGAQAIGDKSLKDELSQFNKKSWRKNFWYIQLYRFFAASLLVVLMVLFFNPFFKRHAGKALRDGGGHLLTGALLLIGLPIVSIIAMATILGIPLGIIGLSLFTILLTLSSALTAVVASYEIRNRQNADWSTGLIILVGIGLVGILKLIEAIPFAGSILVFLVTAVAIGFVLSSLRSDNGDRSGGQGQPTAQQPDYV